MEIQLQVRSKSDGTFQESKHVLDRELVIGRGAECGVVLEGTGLSREHIRLEPDGDGLSVTDLSSNGTWINGARLRRDEKYTLRSGDSIELPGFTLSIATPSMSAATQSGANARSGKMSPLDPVFRLLSSFTATEKFFALVGLCGLLLLYIYSGT